MQTATLLSVLRSGSAAFLSWNAPIAAAARPDAKSSGGSTWLLNFGSDRLAHAIGQKNVRFWPIRGDRFVIDPKRGHMATFSLTRAMGAKSSKPPPHKIEPEATAVEVFEDQAPQAPREPSNHKRQKGVTPVQGGTTHAVRSILQEPPAHAAPGSETPTKPPDGQTGNGDNKNANDEKLKKKRRRSKKDKNKLPPPKLVRAQTQLNELRNVKPLLQQSPQTRQQHFEQIKDAYALDDEAKKAPPPDVRSRFFNFESWRKTPQTPSGKGDAPSPESPPPLVRSQMLFTSSGRSSRGTEEISNDTNDDLEDSHSLVLDDVESFSGAATKSSRITIATSAFLAPSNQVDHGGQLDIQTTPVIRVRTSERRTPEQTKRSIPSQRSDLRLDDVDEDLMEHILTDDSSQ
ncbi:unnamed protein product [Phytophthora fragariaefolia]|uniref:Unnamed protein product n=1 Tax=Phytophthora fragariaefolia TaxID=1490495 RepID=A0A9W6XNL7_9STRA|nr:unnamed protein product [Phytophthora fragariaefolia]